MLAKRTNPRDFSYKAYDPAFEKPQVGESPEEMTEWALLTLRQIEIHRPVYPEQVPRYIYRILSVLYCCYNKQNGNKITTEVHKSVIRKAENRMCKALVMYSEGKRAKASINDMVKELEEVEFAKKRNKRIYR